MAQEFLALDGYSRPLPDYRQRALAARFGVANQAAVTFGAGLSATIATLALVNPAASGKNLLIRSASFAFNGAPAAACTIHLCIGTNLGSLGTPTTITVQNALVGSSAVAPVGVAYSAVTMGAAPVIIRPLTSVGAASSITPAPAQVNLDGEIILKPATFLTFQSLAAAVGFCGLVWEELTEW